MQYEKKIRLRSDEELECQNIGLIEIKEILNSLNIPYLLSSGTLLGAVREKDFIRWDWDVQMYLYMESAYHNRYIILNTLLQNQFKVSSFIDSDDSLKYDLLKRGAKYELTAWTKTRSWRHRKNHKLKVPACLFENPSEIKFRGEIYKTFQDPEKYLEFCYGDWRVPLRTSDKSVYSTKQHLNYSLRQRFVIAVRSKLRFIFPLIRNFIKKDW